MSSRYFEVKDQADGSLVVTILLKHIIQDGDIQEMGRELLVLTDENPGKKIAINFSRTEFMSSAFFGKLILLDKRVKTLGGSESLLTLSEVRREIYEVFMITRLNRLFDISIMEAQDASLSSAPSE
jgi:anti-sigma B factor antagonist